MSQIRTAFAQHRRKLLAYIVHYALQPADVDDNKQETFDQTQEISGKDATKSPKPYLFFARNLIFKHLRDQSKRLMQEIGDVDECGFRVADLPPEQAVHIQNKLDAVLTVANTLPAQYRRIFLMRKLDGMRHCDSRNSDRRRRAVVGPPLYGIGPH